MKIERDERRFDFHDIGLAIKRAREANGMTQEQLAYIVDRAPRHEKKERKRLWERNGEKTICRERSRKSVHGSPCME